MSSRRDTASRYVRDLEHAESGQRWSEQEARRRRRQDGKGTCPRCRSVFDPVRSSQVYDRPACRNAAHRSRKRDKELAASSPEAIRSAQDAERERERLLAKLRKADRTEQLLRHQIVQLRREAEQVQRELQQAQESTVEPVSADEPDDPSVARFLRLDLGG